MYYLFILRGITMNRYPTDFQDRMRQAISDAWEIFQNKVGNNYIVVNKEASMQLHYSYILNSLLPLYRFSNEESATIELETGVNLDDESKEIDLLLKCKKSDHNFNIAVEMKCYREYASSGGKRGATDIFMKDVYFDLELLERYCKHNIADIGIELVMNDLERMVNPKNKKAKCWDYDISNNTTFSNKHLTTPIGGKPVDIHLKKNYTISWKKNGEFWFSEIEGK